MEIIPCIRLLLSTLLISVSGNICRIELPNLFCKLNSFDLFLLLLHPFIAISIRTQSPQFRIRSLLHYLIILKSVRLIFWQIFILLLFSRLRSLRNFSFPSFLLILLLLLLLWLIIVFGLRRIHLIGSIFNWIVNLIWIMLVGIWSRLQRYLLLLLILLLLWFLILSLLVAYLMWLIYNYSYLLLLW